MFADSQEDRSQRDLADLDGGRRGERERGREREREGGREGGREGERVRETSITIKYSM